MGKRVSGAPRRPRNPVAKAVRTPLFRQRVETDKRGKPPTRRELQAQELSEDREDATKDVENDTGDV